MVLFKRFMLGLFAGSLAAFAVAFALAIILGLVDIYLSGHGLLPLSRPWLAYPDWGIHLSRADVILLAGAFIALLTTGVHVAMRIPRRRKIASSLRSSR